MKLQSQQNSLSFGKNKLVYVCTPLAGGYKESDVTPNEKLHIRLNMQKAINYASVVFNNGDIPVWNHSTWPDFVDDTIADQRKRALEGCFALLRRCDALCRFGEETTSGMEKEMKLAKELGIPILRSEELKDIDEIVENTSRYKKLKSIDLVG